MIAQGGEAFDDMAVSVAEPMIWPGLAGKRALVTGASSGLGAHFARLLAAQGVQVTTAARRLDRMEALCADLRAGGAQADPVAMDVADPASVAAALKGKTFDIVINNAGTTLSASALDHEAQDIDRIIDTNLKGAFHVARVTAAAMAGWGDCQRGVDPWQAGRGACGGLCRVQGRVGATVPCAGAGMGAA
jgi:NAD(P)-dependent dehydrogenase (short-subunit alcohol dehydrogenase family)